MYKNSPIKLNNEFNYSTQTEILKNKMNTIEAFKLSNILIFLKCAIITFEPTESRENACILVVHA